MFLFQGVQLLACIVVTKQCQLLRKQTSDKMSRESEHHRTTFAACWARSDVINTQVVNLEKMSAVSKVNHAKLHMARTGS